MPLWTVQSECRFSILPSCYWKKKQGRHMGKKQPKETQSVCFPRQSAFYNLWEFSGSCEAYQLPPIHFENARHTHKLRGSLITINGIIKWRGMCNREQKWIGSICVNAPLGKCIRGTRLSLAPSNHISICLRVCKTGRRTSTAGGCQSWVVLKHRGLFCQWFAWASVNLKSKNHSVYRVNWEMNKDAWIEGNRPWALSQIASAVRLLHTHEQRGTCLRAQRLRWHHNLQGVVDIVSD